MSDQDQPAFESRSVMRRKNILKGRPMNEGVELRPDYPKSCPHCDRSVKFRPIGDTGRFFCPYCWAEVNLAGELVKAPGPGPHTQEDVAWEIYEQDPQRLPGDEPDYKP